MQEKTQYNLSLSYGQTMFRQFPAFTVLPNLRESPLFAYFPFYKFSNLNMVYVFSGYFIQLFSNMSQELTLIGN
jgi:hypothetical protein